VNGGRRSLFNGSAYILNGTASYGGRQKTSWLRPVTAGWWITERSWVCFLLDRLWDTPSCILCVQSG
jgi:hypothetical protein